MKEILRMAYMKEQVIFIQEMMIIIIEILKMENIIEKEYYIINLRINIFILLMIILNQKKKKFFF